MKRIGIITINSPVQNDNYGGVLQNYALTAYLKKKGVLVDDLQFLHVSKKGRPLFAFRLYLYRKYGVKIEFGNFTFHLDKLQHRRNQAFERFADKELNNRTVWISDDHDYDSIKEEYSAFIVGSDQVWNTFWVFDYGAWKEFLLSFAEPKKRFSYAASFGTDTINPMYEDRVKTELARFSAISVREERGKEIVYEIAGREADVLIDPTLLLSKVEWSEFASNLSDVKVEKDYIVTYFLGGISEEVEVKISQLEKERKLKICRLYDRESEELFTVDPAGFVDLIRNAALVLTDSFHACVFSFIFDIPFLVYDRVNNGKGGKMNSRLITFLSSFSLERKYAQSNLSNDLFESNYQTGKARLDTEKEKAYRYLRMILDQ